MCIYQLYNNENTLYKDETDLITVKGWILFVSFYIE